MSDYVADKIRYYRKTKGWTQEELAEKCDGISYASIRRYETIGEGNRDPKTEDLRIIAKALDVNPSVFIEPFMSFSEIDVIAEDGKTYSIDPSCDVITKDGEIVFKAGFHGSNDDLQTYRIKDAPETRVEEAWKTLNDSGKLKAADQVELVSKVPEYREK